MPESEQEPIVLDGRTVVLDPGDRVIVRVDAEMTREGLDKFTTRLRERFPDVEFTFVAQGIQIEAQKPAPDLVNWFTYHPPKGDDVHAYEDVRNAGLTMAFVIEQHVPPSRERDLAFERLREAIMWANAGRACNPQEETDSDG